MELQKIYRILFYNKPFDIDDDELNRQIMDGFELTTERKYMEFAPAIIFYMPSLCRDDIMKVRNKKKGGQIWIFWSTKCEVRYEWQFEPEILSLFDVMATYKLDSDIPIPYFYPDYYGLFRKDPVPKTGFVNAFISGSSDHSNRLSYLKELMSYINVHSYGKMLNNTILANDEGYVTKERIMTRYMFTIAFENSIAKDYVTDILFDPLVVGSVPVYLGAPNVEEFVPGDNCYINVDSFSSIKALADHLLELEANEGYYKEYLRWKTRPFRLAFNLKANIVSRHPIRKICDMIKIKMQKVDKN